LNFTLPPAGIVGIIGPNGAGKTTIFKMIMDQLQPDAGAFDVGETVQISYVDQSHEKLNPEKTIFEVVGEGTEEVLLGGQRVNARAYLSRFNFAGGDQSKKVGVLSGGERNRLHLAMALKEGGNVLLLDEPTNDFGCQHIKSFRRSVRKLRGMCCDYFARPLVLRPCLYAHFIV
jgi:ATPase subunit of ABC transporter with duplicated ATPase domains